MSGKGSAPRPLSVSEEQFGENFDRVDWSIRLEAPTGHPPQAWTEQERADCLAAMQALADREASQ